MLTANVPCAKYDTSERSYRRICAANGVRAELSEGASGRETLRILSASNELLFEHDPITGTTRLMVPVGNLEIVTAQGDLTLRSPGTLRLQANALELQADSRISLALVRGLAAATSWLRLTPGRLRAGSDRVEWSARQAELQLGDATVRGASITAEADVCRIKAGKLETTADTLIERAGNVYRSVRGLVQLQAGRLRTYVSGFSHFRSQRAYFSSEESFHIDGEKIHLG